MYFNCLNNYVLNDHNLYGRYPVVIMNNWSLLIVGTINSIFSIDIHYRLALEWQ